jgi:glyoxalase family protein
MTFFPWPGAIARRIGTGQLTVTSFAVPEKPLGYRKIRLRERGISVQETRSEFDEAVLFFADRDGLQLELVATSHVNPNRVWSRGPVPADFAIRSFHDVTLSESGYERTASLLTDNLGFRRLQERSARFRYAVGTGMPGTIVDLICALEGPSGRVAVGTVHHVAWRTPTDKQQVKWRARLYETCSTT